MKKYRICFLVPNFGASFGRAYSYDDENLIAFEVEVSYAHHDAWGNVLSEGIAKDAVELRTVRYRFQGRERSAATGLTNFRMRWYDAVTGRWLSKDPIGLSGGLNLYAFCGGDPVNQADWIGLCGESLGESIWDTVKNIVLSLTTATQAALPTTISTVANALDGAATGGAFSTQIKAINEVLGSLESGGIESGDQGNVLKDGENKIRSGGAAIDDALNQ